MPAKIHLHSISPKKVLRGKGAWMQALNLIPKLCTRPLVLGRSHATEETRSKLINDLYKTAINPIKGNLKYDCCESDLKNLLSFSKENQVDSVVAAGGGKVLDAGKLLAERINVPCITIPLSASTCAGWTSLSNIYSPSGKFIKDIVLSSCPDLLIFDHDLVKEAPVKTLASGIADGLAKWYESSLSSGSSCDGLVQQSVQMARVLRDQLLLDGYEALIDPESNAWIRVAEACSLTAGLIGGIGGKNCRTAAAHAIHNGLTQLDFKSKALHGEIVGFGILVQLRLEEVLSKSQLPSQANSQLMALYKKLNLPTNLHSLGLKDINTFEISKACDFSCKEGSDIYSMPFEIEKQVLLDAIFSTHEKGLSFSKKESTKVK